MSTGNATNPKEDIVLARNLLRKFQSKNQQDKHSVVNTRNNDSEASLVTFPFDHSGSGNQQEKSSCNESLNNECNSQLSHDSRISSRPPSSVDEMKEFAAEEKCINQNNTNFQNYRCYSASTILTSENVEMDALKRQLSQKQKELDDALSKLQTLHKHYTELHSTYSQIIAEKDSALNISPTDYSEQIRQLRTALSFSLDEKTSLHTELRQIKAEIESRLKGQQSQNNNMPYNHHNHELESSLKKLTNERDNLLDTVRKQSVQIEQYRKECSGLEAKLVLIQQDRLDIQARLKGLYEDKSQLERSLEQLRQDLAMRDIYLRQLARHSDADFSGRTEGPNFCQSPMYNGTGTKNSSDDELERQKVEVMELQKQMQTSRDHYQNSIIQANAQIQKLEMEMGHLKAANIQLESANTHLEEQLRMTLTRNDAQEAVLNREHNNKEIIQSHPDQIVQLEQQNSNLIAERDQANSKIVELKLALEDKNAQLEILNNTLAEAERRLVELEHQQNIQSTMNTDSALLSAQLQNEKATVSRAISQNMELKTQLSELQDRLVSVINESATKEDERLTAIAQVCQLRQQLEEFKGKDGKNEERNIAQAIECNDGQQIEQQESTDVKQQHEVGLVTTANAEHISKHMVEDKRKVFATAAIQTEHFEEPIVRKSADENIEKEEVLSSAMIQKQNPHTQHLTAQIFPDNKPLDASLQQLPDGFQSGESEIQKHNEMGLQLERRLNEMAKENQQFRMDNQKLQYWLTTLETENESIGEYIALYRFQRGNIQKRIAEKEEQLMQLQHQNTTISANLRELHDSILAFLGRQDEFLIPKEAYQQLSQQESSTDESPETTNVQEEVSPEILSGEDRIPVQVSSSEEASEVPSDGHEKPAKMDEMERLKRALEKCRALGSTNKPTANCQPNCSTADSNAQIHCTGCMECRGEMFTL